MHSRASSSTGRAVEQIITAVRLAALVIFVELALRVTSLERVCRLLDVSFDVSTCASTDLYDQSDPHVVRSQRRVERVSRRIGLGDRCLRRCVVLAVEIRDSTPILRIGVRRLNDKSFAAHSWLELAGGSLDSDANQYQPAVDPRRAR
ncbi:lasso peptide biosynthesis B2 protein [Rhodococcus sp. AW25M09]|uniref:lasso peptide biosynthesis B2 protein n=1 Tax=Rhodococcus sp. AW25M09 TaxID=1268303 RepID=UPI003FA6ACF3